MGLVLMTTKEQECLQLMGASLWIGGKHAHVFTSLREARHTIVVTRMYSHSLTHGYQQQQTLRADAFTLCNAHLCKSVRMYGVHMCPCRHVGTQIRTQPHTQARMDTCTHAGTHAGTHVCAPAYTCARAHTRTTKPYAYVHAAMD